MTDNINTQSMLPVGTLLQGGKYRIDRYLSSGGFGNTYVATNVMLEEQVALKEFYMRGINERADDSVTVSVSNQSNEAQFGSQRQKFMKEARRLFKLRNDHIVSVYDLFEENGTSYYVMEFIKGESLSARLKRTQQPIPEQEALSIVSQVLDALEAVHAQGLYHLDIKPANIMVDSSGRALLIDFGASKQTRQDGGATTSTGLCYTPGYAPIEQMEQNMEKFGPWTDIYALGATLYHVLTLRPLPAPTDIQEEGAAALPMPGVSQPTQQLILTMLTPLRTRRPQSVAAVRQLMNAQPATPTAAKPTFIPPTPGPPKWNQSTTEETITIQTNDAREEKTVVSQPVKEEDVKSESVSNEKPVLDSSSGTPYKKIMAAAAIIVLVVLIIMGISNTKNDAEEATKQDYEVEELQSPRKEDAVTVDNKKEKEKSKEENKQAERSQNESERPNDDSQTPVRETNHSSEINDREYQAPIGRVEESKEKPKEDRVFDIVEQQPTFSEGNPAAWLAKHYQYPTEAQEENIQGRVTVGFVVERDGTLSNVRVLRGVDPALDKEAIRVVKSMPKWNPGTQDGVPVRVNFTVPVNFKLQ